MRCLSCNVILNDTETTRKSVVTGDYLDLCNRCLGTIDEDVLYIEPDDLFGYLENETDNELIIPDKYDEVLDYQIMEDSLTDGYSDKM